MSYPNLPKSEYFQVFLAFQSCKASALLRPQHKKSNGNLSLYRSKIYYRTDFWSIKAKTERILHGFASILTKSERKSVYKKQGSDNSFHPKIKEMIPKGIISLHFNNICVYEQPRIFSFSLQRVFHNALFYELLG